MTDEQEDLWGARAAAWGEQEERQAPVYAEVLRRTGCGAGQAVLDLGCGAGSFLRQAAARGARVAGLDASPGLLALAHERVPAADLRLGALDDLPFEDHAFDLVTAFNSVFFAADPTAALREAARVARPGATVVIQVWGRPERCDLTRLVRAVATLRSEAPATPAWASLWVPGALEALAAGAGLTAEGAYDVTSELHYPDEATMVRCLTAAGGVVEVARKVGDDAVREAVVEALRPCRTAGGAYHLRNEWHLLTARTAHSDDAPTPARSGGAPARRTPSAPSRRLPDTEVAVVGAGAAGIAAAAELARAGVAATVLERGEGPGAAWRSRYDRLRLNTPRWTSALPRARYAPGTALFPARDDVVAHLEENAARGEVRVEPGVEVHRLDRDAERWLVRTSAGELRAAHVVVATGFARTPVMPRWPGRERWRGELLHASAYRHADAFAGREVLVVGPGSSGLEIAYDLVAGGAGRVRVAVRTPPNIMLRQSLGLPGDLPAGVLRHLPTRLADAQAALVRRLTVGDLRPYGLAVPPEGVFARHHREHKAPAIVDKEVIAAIRDGRIQVVGAVAAFDETAVVLADGSRLEPDAVIAATGYTPGLEAMVGHLGVLDGLGCPEVHGGPEALPGLRFVGYAPGPGQIRRMGRHGARAARAIAREVRATG